jgi:peptide/nickel transport system substrate-binding protein
MKFTSRIIYVLAFIIFVASCRKSSNNSGNNFSANEIPSRGDWVVQHETADPECLNPSISSDATSSEMFNYLYQRLTVADPNSLIRKPQISENVPVDSGDHLQYDFNLNKKAVFSDGKPITAADFIFYLKVIKNPLLAEAEPHRGYLTDVFSAEIIDNDPYKLRFKMIKPNCLAIQSISEELYAVPKHIWDVNNISDKISWQMLDKPNLSDTILSNFANLMKDANKNTDPKYIIGSGTYLLSEFKRNERVVFERNEKFWGGDSAYNFNYPDKIIFRTINDYNAALSSLKGGEIDFMPTMPKVLYNNVKNSFNSVKVESCKYDFPSYDYVGYNSENPIFKDKNVRKALAYAINRDEIISKIYFNMANKVQSPLYYKSKEYNQNIPLIEYNVEKAKSLLKSSGWTDSDGDGILDKEINGKKLKFKFEFILNSDNTTRNQIALVLIDAFRKLGIEATVTGLEWATLLKRLKNHEFDATVSGWATDPFESDLYQLWHSGSAIKGGSNYVSFKNQEVDDLIIKMRTEFDLNKRKLMNYKLQEIINEEQPINFLVSALRTGARSNRFQNVNYFSARPGYNIAAWWIPQNLRKYNSSGKSLPIN